MSTPDADRRPNRDILQRFPELGLIEDSEIRDETGYLLQTQSEPYFWIAPAASSTDYHNQYCWGKCGLWIHTKMVFSSYERHVDSDLVAGRITEYEADLGRAAVLLHDYRKYGDSWSEGDYADTDHDLQAAALIREHSDLPDKVADAVASHMGPFENYEGPLPETPLQWLIHRADMGGSCKGGTWGVYQPHETIRDLYPAIPRVNL